MSTPASTRRSFVKRSSAAGAGLLLCSARTAFGTEANSKLNIAAIGAGGMGEGNVGALSGEHIVAICDVDERRCASTRSRHKGAKFYRDFRRMLDEMDGQIDAVMVATPDHTHAVAAIAAMKLGKHVYCEKPLTRTVHEARAMREAAAAHAVVTQMGNQGSASEGVRRGTEWAWSGTAGAIREAYLWVSDGSATMTRPADRPEVPRELDWDLWLGPATERPYHPAYLPATWRGWRHFGSGSLGDMGCHTGNLLFRALRLKQLWEPGGDRAIRVEGEATGVHDEGYPSASRVVFDIPARGELPPVKLTVSSGVEHRPAGEMLHGETAGSFGALLVGTEASIYTADPWNRSSSLLPKGKADTVEQPPKSLPRTGSHHGEWVAACKGEGETFSSFAIGGPLTELIQLANIGGIVGEPFTYDPLTGEVAGSERAAALLHREYREGWSL